MKSATWFIIIINLLVVPLISKSQNKINNLGFSGFYYSVTKSTFWDSVFEVSDPDILNRDSSLILEEVFFYEDSTVALVRYKILQSDTLNERFFYSLNKDWQSLKDWEIRKAYFDWGYFKARNDSIKLIYFALPQMLLKKRVKTYYTFKLKNGDIILLLTEFSKAVGRIVYNKPLVYKFFPFQAKPDSTLAWFKKKQRYKNETLIH